MEVTAITRRADAILTSIISQVTPSESSLIKRVAYEPMFLSHLRDTVGIRGVRRVALHEPLTNLRKWIVIQVARDTPQSEVWRALYAAAGYLRAWGKFIVAVNEDIDPDNADALLWALAYRCNPALDMEVLPHRDQGHGPRSARNGGMDAAVLYDATLKEDYPPISLPKRPYMERARAIWEELGLPRLKPEAPWHGTSLGEWSDEFERAAEMAVKGDYFETGKAIAQRRRKDVAMNTDVRRVSDDD
jgi:4-hydroxy-3-polyprenylbenzoate decarboxylase